MNFIKSALSLERAKIWVFCAVCFVLPMNASYIYTLTALLLILWIVEGNLREKLKIILASKLCLACLFYFFVYVLAMLWTEDVLAGWRMVGRQIPFLLFPIYWTSTKPEHKERYISAFVVGLCVCALLAHYNFFQLHFFTGWLRGVMVSKRHVDTAPFVDWIMYAPMLAMGTYFALRRLFFANEVSMRLKWGIASALLLSNLAFSGGRAGMVMFFALFITLVFERINKRIKAALICSVLIPILFSCAYFGVDSFASRVNRGISDIKIFNTNHNTSVGLRLVYWTKSFGIFLNNPVLGVGSGDFALEFDKVKPDKWPPRSAIHNPHNQYLMTAVTTGLLGLLPLIYIFFLMASKGDFRARSFLAGFLVLCIFESYLWRSNTGLAFCVLMAVLLAEKTLSNASHAEHALPGDARLTR